MGDGNYLILGGARSGKSALAEKIAMKLSANPAYIATAQSPDAEMTERIEKHRLARAKNFTTIEEPIDLALSITRAADEHNVILVDCLTLWMSNISFDKGVDASKNIAQLFETLNKIQNNQIIFVSNEVGLGIVPDNRLARSFRDQTGLLHQQLGEVCKNVVFVVAGLPMIIKGKVPL